MDLKDLKDYKMKLRSLREKIIMYNDKLDNTNDPMLIKLYSLYISNAYVELEDILDDIMVQFMNPTNTPILEEV